MADMGLTDRPIRRAFGVRFCVAGFVLAASFYGPFALRPAQDPKTVHVTDVSYISTTDSTTVTIHLDNDVDVEKGKLDHPERFYLDLIGAKLDYEPRGKVIPVKDHTLKQIRVAQYTANVVRVVLDLAADIDGDVSSLYDPFRIVIRVRRTHPTHEPTVENPPTENPTIHAAERPRGRESERSEQQDSDEAIFKSKAAPVPTELASKNVKTLTRALGLKIRKIIIDPGHGGWDAGTISKNGLREKDLVLAIAKKLCKRLEQRLGAEVILTRTTDIFIPLEERTALANEQSADLFVSIHANSSKNDRINGVETYFLSLDVGQDSVEVAARENSAAQKNVHELEDLVRKIALQEKLEESRELASIMQKNLFNGMKKYLPKTRNRGVKHAPFIVLMGAHMPSVLVELAFLSNPKDEKFLRQNASRDKIAEALYRGIEAYVKVLGRSRLALDGGNQIK